MVDIHAHPGGSLAIGRRGENEARRVVFDLAAWRRHYGEGTVQLLHQRAGDENPYPCTLTVEGDTAYWLIQAADVAKAGWGSVQLHYYVGDTLAKSAIWRTVTADALSDPSEPPEDPARAWFAAIREQIGNLDELTTKAKDNLVAAINEVAQSGGGGTGGTSDHTKLKNRDADDQHPMSAITGLTNALAGKQPTGNYMTQADLQDATDKALAQAKASGEFDGATGPQGPAGAGMDITGATVGQIAKITAVDTDGKPIAWEPADLPGGETWELIASGEMQETAKLEITKDNNGLPFSLKSAQIFVRGDISISTASSMRVSAERFGSARDYDSYSTEVYFQKENPKVNLWYVLREKTMPMLFWEVEGGSLWNSADCKVLMGVHRHFTATENVYGKDPLNHLIDKVSIGHYMGAGDMAAGCKYEIWGVRA